MTVLNTGRVGVSLVGQVVWNTEPVRFFFFGHFVFFRAPALLWWKKSDEKHGKKSTYMHMA